MQLTRRQFLRASLFGMAWLGIGGFGYSLLEAKWCRITRVSIQIPHLPPAFIGTRVALLADIHHSSCISLDYINRAVDMTNALKPDLVCLCGDYVYHGKEYIAPCLEALGRLDADMGLFGVLGNHDHWESAAITREAMAANGITDLTNTGLWLEKGGDRLRLCGVGDLWEDRQDSAAALGDVGDEDAAIMLSHNPDYAEKMWDTRVGLMLSGHTHGGQVDLPFFGPPLVPSRHGQKFAQGLVKTKWSQVFVTRGTGSIPPPVRFRCRPEVVELTLTV